MLFANADEVAERRAYIINTGDQLLISVVGHENERTVLSVVRPDGMISYPAVGDVKAAGLTIAQLSHAISKRLSTLKFYENPQVTVQLEVSRHENVYIFGDVEIPGLKQFPGAVNVVEVLAAAGGFKDTADLASAIIIKTRKKEVIPVDLRVLLDERDAISDKLLNDRLMLEEGDVLIVPSSLKAERVSVIGFVREPGEYPVKSKTTLVKILAIAGGPVEPDADLRHIRVIRAEGGVIVANVTRSWTGEDQNPPSDDNDIPYIHPGDSVFVPEKGKINIFGAVKIQGQFGVDDEISIIEALTLAGIEDDSNLGKLKIIRSTGQRLTVDAWEIWERPGPEAEITLSPGDTLIVPTVFKIDWNMVNVGVLILGWAVALFVK